MTENPHFVELSSLEVTQNDRFERISPFVLGGVIAGLDREEPHLLQCLEGQ